MIITKTPFRLSFFGGGSDHNSWFEENRGLVVGSTISRYCYISLRDLPPFFNHKSRVVYSVIEDVKDNRDIQHPSVRACLEEMEFSEGLEIHHDGDLPARSGLGSSSTFTVGLLNALNAYRGKMVSRQELAEKAIFIEQNVLKEHVGIQDQIFAAYGGFNVIRMGPGKKFEVYPLPLTSDYKQYLESNLLLGFTGISRISSDLAKAQIENIRTHRIDSDMKEICGIAEEGLSMFQRGADAQSIGKLLDQSWQHKRNCSDQVSSPLIDEVYQNAIKLGAFGGKVMGAGGGGFMMFLAPPEAQAKLKSNLRGINVWVNFKFEEEGSRVIVYKGH